MQVIGNAKNRSENFNGVSEKLKQELIKPVKSGEIVYFQLLNGSYDAQLKREVFGASKSIPLKDRIFDPYAEVEKDDKGVVQKDDKGQTKYIGAYVEIGVPEDIINGRVERCKKFWVESIANGIPGNGQFDFMGGNIPHMEIYEFLCLSNKSTENPYRDKSKEPLYKKVNPDEDRKKEDEKAFRETVAKMKRFAKDPEKKKELEGLLNPTPA